MQVFPRFRRILAGLCALLIILNSSSLLLAEALKDAREIDVVDTMTNYDPKMLILKTVWNDVGTAQKEKRPVDWGALKSKLTRKSLLVHLAVDSGAGIAAMGLQYVLMGVAPPLGTAVGGLLATTICGFAGAIGYEMSEDIESNRKLPFSETMGRALKKIDATNFAARTLGGAVGAVIGQVLCPIPFLGVVLGGMVGGFLGGTLANFFVKTKFGKSIANRFQNVWDKGAQKLIDMTRSRRGDQIEDSLEQAPEEDNYGLIARLRNKLIGLHNHHIDLLSSDNAQEATLFHKFEIEPLLNRINQLEAGLR